MARVSILLIVTMLAGGPVGSVGCELWCASPAADDHHRSAGCHDASRSVPPRPQIASSAGCHDAAAITPFVTEARRTEFAPGAASPLPASSSNASGRGNDEAIEGASLVNVQPPRPPSSRPVLRM